MIGLLLVAHAGLARELLKAAEMISGEIEMAEAIEINPGDSVEAIHAAIGGAVERLGKDGLIIMTDMFGGTPANMGLSFLAENRVEVLTGVNLSMVIKFASDRKKCQVADLVEKLKKCGLESISVAGNYLKK